MEKNLYKIRLLSKKVINLRFKYVILFIIFHIDFKYNKKNYIFYTEYYYIKITNKTFLHY